MSAKFPRGGGGEQTHSQPSVYQKNHEMKELIGGTIKGNDQWHYSCNWSVVPLKEMISGTIIVIDQWYY